MRHGKHIHTAGDGRGPRDVFFNGKLVDRVMYADTRAGIVRVVGSPVKLDKWKKRVLTRTLRGTVEVRVKVGAGGTVKPVAWVRFCSDGCYEGPIMDEQIEDVRKNSGAWTPLYARHNA